MYAILKAGTQNGAGTIQVEYSTALVKLRNRDAGTAQVKLNGVTVTLGASMVNYEDFWVNAPTIEVVTGNVDYIALG